MKINRGLLLAAGMLLAVSAHAQFASLSITPASGTLSTGTTGKPYSVQLTASGGSGNYSWSILNQSSGWQNLVIAPQTGSQVILSGTPVESDTDAGLTVTIRLTDSEADATLDRCYTIPVVQAQVPQGTQPPGTTAFVVNGTSALASVTGGQVSTLENGNCDFCAVDIARDTAGNFIVAAGGQLNGYTASGGALAGFPILIVPNSNSYYSSVAIDGSGNYIVADNINHKVLRITPAGVIQATIPYPVNYPSDTEDAYVRVDSSGNYIVAEDNDLNADTNVPLPVTIYKITPGGTVTNIPVVPTGNSPVPASTQGLTFDAAGNYVVVDYISNIEGVYTIIRAGAPNAGASTPLYLDTNAYLWDAFGIYRDPLSGYYFIVDDDNGALYSFAPDGSNFSQIAQDEAIESATAVVVVDNVTPGHPDFVLESDGTIVPVGGGPAISCGQNCPNGASDFAVDLSGNFILAAGCSLVSVTPTGSSSVITITPAPQVTPNWVSVAIDSSGYIIAVDNKSHQIFRISPTGVAGTPIPYQVDSPSSREDVYVRIDSTGNYILAHDNSTFHLYRIPAGGTPTEIVVTGAVPATLGGLTFDTNGNFVVLDSDSTTVDLVTAAPNATTGTGSVLFANTNETLTFPVGIFRDPISGNYLIGDQPDAEFEPLYSLNPGGTQLTLVDSGLTGFPVAVLTIPFAITTSSLPGGTQGQTYSPVTLTATGGVPPYSWQATGLPPGLNLTTAGVLNGIPGSGGNYTAHVTLTDFTQNSVSANIPLAIAGQSALPPPPPSISIITSSLPNGTVGTPYGPIGLSASGGTGNYSWSAIGAPAGLGLSSSGQLSGTPTAAGSFNVTVSVTDAGLFAQRTFSITVALGPLTLNGSANPGGFAAGAAISSTYSASGGSPPYKWSASGLPAGLTLDPSSGLLSGSSVQPGNYNFGVQVTDSQPVSVSLNVTLFVLGVGTSSLSDASNNIPYSQTLSAVGGSGPYSWSLSGGLPTGLTLSGSGVLTGTPVLSGTPTTTQSFPFAVSVTSNGVTVSKNLTLNVTIQAQPLSIPGAGSSPVALPSGAVQAGYSQAIQAAGGIPPYSWQVLAGSQPDGVSLGSSGTVSGTPSKPGTFSFTGQVRDSAGATAAGGFSILIAPPGLTISTGSTLPNGIAGTNYPTQTFTASGGNPPYTFDEKGALPAGLTFQDGEISGTPTTPGTSSFTITVTDSSQPALTASSEFQIPVTPAHTDLVLSQTSLSFSFYSGAPSLPSGPSSASVTVGSNSTQVLGFSTSVSPAVSWLNVTGTGQTPGSISVSLDPKALTLPAGSQKASIVVTCTTPSLAAQPSPCAGTTQTISVTLNVISAPPQLLASPAALSFAAQTGSPQSQSQSLIIQNGGGGILTIASITSPDSFVTFSGVPSTIAASGSATVGVNVNSTGLSAGLHRSSILVTSSAGSAIVSVSLLVAQNSTMTLNPSGTQFQMSVGSSPGNPNGSFQVSTTSKTDVGWTAAVVPGSPWLQLTNTNVTSSASNPGTVSFTINSAAAAALTAKAYYGTIRVTSGNFVNSPQDFVVVLNVVAAVSSIQPDPEPAGLIFIANPTSALPSQTVQVFAGTSSAVSYSAATDSPWLTVASSSGSASIGSPDTSRISVSTAGLGAGVYHGGVSYQFTAPGSSSAVRTVNVTLIVEKAGPGASDRTGLLPQQAAGCTATQLVPTQTGLVSAFAQPASWPTPLSVRVLDDCGKAVTNGQVVATFSNGDPPLALSVTDATSGNYAGTWTPRKTSSQITISARASASGFTPASVQIAGQVVPNAAPLLDPNGMLNAFAPIVGAPVAPGTIVQIYGSHLAALTGTATTVPLPSKLNSTSVLIGGILAPLYYVSPGQINAQVPFELIGGNQYQVIVNANGVLSTPNPIQLAAAAPGIAGFATGQIIAQHLDGSLVLDSAPAAPGEVIIFYVSGMGLTNQTVTSGEASPSTNLASPLDPPTLTLGDIPIAASDILFSGLTPTLVGLYQIDFRVPAATPNGALQLVVTQSDGSSNTTVVPVHN